MADNVAYGSSIFGVAGTYTTPIKMASGVATAASGTTAFNKVSGGTVNYAKLTIPVPNGARGIIAVVAEYTSGGNGLAASPLGGLENVAACLAIVTYAGTQIASGGPLSLTTSSIVIPADQNSGTYNYTVLYY